MSGLRERERDATLPARAAQAHLCAPAAEEVAAWIDEHLRLADAPEVASVVREHVRWKPEVAITVADRVRFSDGREAVVVAKRYVGDKARIAAQRRWTTPACDLPLRPRAAVPAEGLLLWVFPAERRLRGLGVVYDAPRFARFVERAGLAPRRSLERPAARAALLRYKPERRAVVRWSAPRRDRGTVLDLAVRILPPEAAERIACTRAALPADAGWPALVAARAEKGLLVEPWLEVEACAPDDFTRALDAGCLLARLHRHRAPRGLAPRRTPSLSALGPLFEIDVRVAAAAAGLRERPRALPTVWTHGDVHPDQLARRTNGAWMLLDWDVSGPGDPADDLASWIADRLTETPEADEDEAAALLLAGYESAGGVVPADDHLREAVAIALVHRAAATIRRLERGAVERACALLARARTLAPRGRVFR